jgi:HEAT repeat protein
MWSRISMTRCIFIALLLLAGCAQSPERSTVRTANALLKEGQLQKAMDVVDAYLAQHPGATEVLRERVIILLKAERMEIAALAVKRLPKGDPVLNLALRHRDPTVRSNAARIVADEPTSATFSALAHSLDDPVPAVRSYCARALGKLRNTDAVKPLFRLLGDDNWLVRAEAATALGKVGDPRAAGWVVCLLNDRDGFVRYSAMHALQQLACESNRALLLRAFDKARNDQQFGIAFALAKLHEPAALGPLLLGSTNANPEIRQHAAEALGDCGQQAATNALTKLLNDPEPMVREQASQSLHKLRGEVAPVRAPH